MLHVKTLSLSGLTTPFSCLHHTSTYLSKGKWHKNANITWKFPLKIHKLKLAQFWSGPTQSLVSFSLKSSSILQPVRPHFVVILKETYYAHLRFIVLFWVTARIGAHVLMIKKSISDLILFRALSLYSLSLSLKRLVLAPVSLRPPLLSPTMGLLKHAWASITNNDRAVVLNQFLHTKLDAKGMDFANVWHGEVVWRPKVTELKASLAGRHFRSSVFCGREELLLVWTIKQTVGKGNKCNSMIGLLYGLSWALTLIEITIF